jgi:hypothetical protein
MRTTGCGSSLHDPWIGAGIPVSFGERRRDSLINRLRGARCAYSLWVARAGVTHCSSHTSSRSLSIHFEIRHSRERFRNAITHRVCAVGSGGICNAALRWTAAELRALLKRASNGTAETLTNAPEIRSYACAAPSLTGQSSVARAGGTAVEAANTISTSSWDCDAILSKFGSGGGHQT